MATKIKNRITPRKEVELLRSLVIGMLGKDKEGEYRSEFVKKILRAAQEKAPYSFKNRESFLRHVNKYL